MVPNEYYLLNTGMSNWYAALGVQSCGPLRLPSTRGKGLMSVKKKEGRHSLKVVNKVETNALKTRNILCKDVVLKITFNVA